MEKNILALDENETFSFKYGEVIWKIAPLDFSIKKRLQYKTTIALNNKENVCDLVDIALECVSYGLKGWEGFKYSDGREAKCNLIKDKNGIECLDQKTLELIYRSSAFGKISEFCQNPHSIPDYMKENVEFSNVINNLSPECLDDSKKK